MVTHVRTLSGLEVRGLVVRYGEPAPGPGTTAVDRVDLDVAPGEVLALLGPSGCGKSSLLRAVAGLEPLAAGSVHWSGRDVAGVPVHQRSFGLLFQDGQLFPHRDVARNVSYGLEGRGQGALPDRAARRDRVDELLTAVGLAGYGRRRVDELSGGERQRVALARALAPRPELLLLDEPLSALDRSLRERLATEVRAALVATGTTALFVTHDHDEAFTVADRVAVMARGRLLRVDTPTALWAEPSTREVAEFLGYEMVVPAAVARDWGVVVAGSPEVALAPGALRRVGARERARVTGTVTEVGFRGGRSQLTVRVAGRGLDGDDVVGELTVLEGPGPVAVAVGDEVGLVATGDGVSVLR